MQTPARAECEALAAGAGSSSGSSLIDGSGAPPAVTGSIAGESSVTGLRAGASLMLPSSAGMMPTFTAVLFSDMFKSTRTYDGGSS